MSAIVTELVAVMTALFTFVTTNLVPADAASLNIVHVGFWTPVIIGLTLQLVGMVRGFRGGRK
jgi:hypothetical protein